MVRAEKSTQETPCLVCIPQIKSMQLKTHTSITCMVRAEKSIQETPCMVCIQSKLVYIS